MAQVGRTGDRGRGGAARSFLMKPGWPPSRPALVTVFQVAEDLTDRQAHVISAIRDLNRLELAGESVRACLEQLAAAAPQVVAQLLDDSWGKRYAASIDTWRMPASATRKAELALAYGHRGERP